jgi:hypothetical protein
MAQDKLVKEVFFSDYLQNGMRFGKSPSPTIDFTPLKSDPLALIQMLANLPSNRFERPAYAGRAIEDDYHSKTYRYHKNL